MNKIALVLFALALQEKAPEGATVLEIGSGWQPIIPILYHLAGARRVLLVDSHPLLTAQTFHRALSVVREHADLASARLAMAKDEVITRLSAPGSASRGDLFEQFRFTYLAPSDAANLDLQDGSVDLIVSRAVFEHIPPALLERILAECHRGLNASGLMCHLIDNSDHWANLDKCISLVNLLKFDESV